VFGGARDIILLVHLQELIEGNLCVTVFIVRHEVVDARLEPVVGWASSLAVDLAVATRTKER